MRFLYFLFLLITISAQTQELTGLQLLDKAIEVHDPYGNRASFNERFNVSMSIPD